MFAKIFGEPNEPIDLPFECEIHNHFPQITSDGNYYKVLNLSSEPPAFMMDSDSVRAISEKFDLILTYDEKLLDLPNAKKLLYGTSWISDAPPKKEFSVSMLYSKGAGVEMPGYSLRKKIWELQQHITIPKKFWTSSVLARAPNVSNLNPYPFKSKDGLFESMFSIVIENDVANNYFTEKIMDAFRTFTVPIYYGCPNISDFFDCDSIIKINDIKELIIKINELNPDFYWRHIDSLTANFQTAAKFIDYSARLRSAIIDGYMVSVR
jgi:hypothetical protein